MRTLVALLLAVEVGGAFGTAAASGTETGPGVIEVELRVDVAQADGPVLAHLTLPGEETQTRPLVDQGDGTWETTVEVRAADWRVVFEAVAAGELSQELSLSNLGVERDLLAEDPAIATVPDTEIESTPWSYLLVAVLAAAGAVGLLVYAVFGLRARRRPSPPSRRSAPS